MTGTEQREAAAVGFGRRMRKEDARFLRGKGQYLDDVQLPGMLHGAILRSPYAHARINSIDISAAEAHPKVRAVITGELLATPNLAWRPPMSGHGQALLATDKVTGKLTCWITSQAPHAHRTVYALVAGLPEHKIQVISPDIGGGFGNKVPVYPGYVCVVVASIVTGAPVKWVEDRSENLMTTGFARDYHMHGEIAATRDGRILALRTE